MSQFPSLLAQHDGQVLAEAVGRIVAHNDTSSLTPLPITDLMGIPITEGQLTANAVGVLPPFRTSDTRQVVSWVSGSYRMDIPSIDMLPINGNPGQILSITDNDQLAWIEPPQSGGSVERVRVVTGQEVRPDRELVIWMGGEVQPANMAEADLWFTGGAPLPPSVLTITTPALNSMIAFTGFSQLIAASGVPGPYQWSATGLPAGLSINATTGQVSGSPSATGSGTATVRVQSGAAVATKAFSWTVSAASVAPTVLASPAPPSMVVGQSFLWTPGSTGSTPMTWGVSAGALPAGLGINSSTGAVSGTPTAAGSYSFTLQAVNSTGSNTRQFTGTVTASANPTTRSVFGTTVPGVLTSHDDSDVGSWLAHQFIVPGGQSLSNGEIVGARLYVPAGSPIIGQTWQIALTRNTRASGFFKVGDSDFGGQSQFTSNGTLTTVAAPLVAGWNEAMYAQAWPGVGPWESFVIGVMIGNGTRYLFNTTLPAEAIAAQNGAPLQLAASGVANGEAVRSYYRGTPAAGAVRWYGIDALVRV